MLLPSLFQTMVTKAHSILRTHSKPVPHVIYDGVSHLHILGLSLYKIKIYGPQWTDHKLGHLSFADNMYITRQSMFSSDPDSWGKAFNYRINSKMKRMDLVFDALDHSGFQIKAVFQVLATPSSYPVIICDTYGSYSTSLIICLVLLLLGLDVSSISRDHMRTNVELESIREERLAMLKSAGFGEEFAQHPETWVPDMENHLRKYGGAEKYLLSIGLKVEEVESVKRILVDRDELPEYTKTLRDD